MPGVMFWSLAIGLECRREWVLSVAEVKVVVMMRGVGL